MKMTGVFVSLFCLVGALWSGEVFEKDLELIALQNIEQVTFASMGFEKAGESYFSPDGKEIIFQAVPKGEEHYQIYTMKLEERIPKMVSTGKGACTCGFYRPDGKKIIFASSHESPEVPKKANTGGKYTWDLTPYMNIYEADRDGSNLKRLTSGAAYHAECGYSCDGARIVFASNEDGTMNLYSMNGDGSDVLQLTHTSHCYNGGPFFSPDASKIIFRADRDRAHYLQIFMINADGSEEKQLTFGEKVNWAPFWHPNGRVIAYTTSRHGHGSYEIYLLNVFTGAEYRLTHNASFDGLPSFSSDGKKILWTSKRDSDACQIFMADFSMPDKIYMEDGLMIHQALEDANKTFFSHHSMQLKTLKSCRETIPTLADWVYEEWSAYDTSLTKERLIHSFQKRLNDDRVPITFVAMKDEAPIGVISLKEHSDPELSDFPKGSLWLGTLKVVPKEKHAGLDVELLKFATTLAKRLGYKEMYFYISNPNQVDWYVDNGAEVIQERPFRNHTITIFRVRT